MEQKLDLEQRLKLLEAQVARLEGHTYSENKPLCDTPLHLAVGADGSTTVQAASVPTPPQVPPPSLPPPEPVDS